MTLVLSKLITWMRSQQGTGDLRVLVYMDEVFGFVPPVANPPTKGPILTLLKQARAYGVGLLLSTQNPVDLDYKAMSNAGTWCIGRLQTERDKTRIVQALASASGGVDVDELAERISGLAKRAFVLHNTHESEPQLFTTRWAMSYLRGPLTTIQISALTPMRKEQRFRPLWPPGLPDRRIQAIAAHRRRGRHHAAGCQRCTRGSPRPCCRMGFDRRCRRHAFTIRGGRCDPNHRPL